MPFLERDTELNPTMPGLFNFQVTHTGPGYGEAWKEKGVFGAYLMKRSHADYPLPCARLKSFINLDIMLH